MPDWTKTMEQSYEYYTVEPTTLADVQRLDTVKKASFTRDSTLETLGSASFEASNLFGETYLRGYLKTNQNGISEKVPLGTYLVQTPSSSFNGKVSNVTMDAYTPLIELKENKPPLGYTVRKGERILDAAYRIVSENCRVPVSKVEPLIHKSRNLLDYSQCTFSHCVYNEDTGIITSAINNSYYCVIRPKNLNDFFLEHQGETFALSTKTCPDDTYINVVIFGTRSNSTFFEKWVPFGKTSNTFTVPTDFTQITSVEIRFNRKSDPFSDTTTEFTEFQLELGSFATPYEPYFEPTDESPTLQRNFVANTDDTWLSFVIDLLKQAKYELGLEPTGQILFQPKQELESLQPVWTYNDDNSSILYSEITMDHDLYGVPNRVEVVYSYGNIRKEAVAINDDPNSPTSIVNRGRPITFRDPDPALAGYVTDDQIQDYAERLLKELSTVEYTISYKHAYCPVRVGDCVRLNYTKAGMSGIKAKVISQNFSSDLACPVSEKAVFTQKLWR